MTRKLEIGKVYRHFKGNYYFVQDIAKDSETKEDFVVYRALYPRSDSSLWIRPLSMFLEEIDCNRKDNLTKQIHRFELAEEIKQDYTKNRRY